MNKKTLKALKASIDHWYRISACETVAELLIEGWHSDDCPLCRVFDATMIPDYRYSRGCCMWCPVEAATGKQGCNGSPYNAAAQSLSLWTCTGVWYNTDQANIEAEIRFLESLLPGE